MSIVIIFILLFVIGSLLFLHLVFRKIEKTEEVIPIKEVKEDPDTIETVFVFGRSIKKRDTEITTMFCD